MSLKKLIEEKLNEALKAKDKKTYPTLRLVVSAIKDAEIAGRSKGQTDIKDSDIVTLLKKMIKQRNESCDVYKKAGRTELLESENREIEVISKSLLSPRFPKEFFRSLNFSFKYKDNSSKCSSCPSSQDNKNSFPLNFIFTFAIYRFHPLKY